MARKNPKIPKKAVPGEKVNNPESAKKRIYRKKKKRHPNKNAEETDPVASTSTRVPLSEQSRPLKTDVRRKRKRDRVDTREIEASEPKKRTKKKRKSSSISLAGRNAEESFHLDDTPTLVANDEDLSDNNIPNETTIQRAKKKRAKRRHTKHQITDESRALLKSLGRNARKAKFRVHQRQVEPAPTRPYEIKLVKSLHFGEKVGYAKENEYNVKFANSLFGIRIDKLLYALESLFDDILADAALGLKGNDLARVVVMHDSIDNPIVVPLRPIDQLSGGVVLTKIENTLNSVKTLKMDKSFRVNVGVIELPKFGGRGRSGDSSEYESGDHEDDTSIDNESLESHSDQCNDSDHYQHATEHKGNAPRKPSRMYIHTELEKVKKRSLITVTQDGVLCMSRSIIICWVKHCQVPKAQFAAITHPDFVFAEKNGLPKPNNMSLFFKYKICTNTFYNSVKKKVYYARDKTRRPSPLQRKMAIQLCHMARVNPDIKTSLSDVEKFEKVTGMDICICSRQAENKFITPPTRGRNKLFLYKDGEHFDAIVNVTGFFPKSKFCYNCLQPYESATSHVCDICCDMCARQGCVETSSEVCLTCNRSCRNAECLQIHRDKDICERKWKCRLCKATYNLKKQNRKPADHKCGEYLCVACNRYVTKPHLCFTRAAKPVQTPLKVIHFDFECVQDIINQCDDGYKATNPDCCSSCVDKISKCSACFRCKNCNNEACGRQIHTPNFVIAHSSCDMCEMFDVDDEAKCSSCGSRCEKCNQIVKGKSASDGKYEYAKYPCKGCGKRKAAFEGMDTLNMFGKWLFNTSHTDCTVIAHNMKGYDGVFLTNYLTENGLAPKITYSGSKIMSIHVEKGLNIRVIDSMNFLQTSLAAFPKTFGLKNMKKGEFPHLFNTEENQNYIGPYPSPDFYNVNSMTKERRKTFFKWYKRLPKDAVFDFKKEMASYCTDDVNILRQGTLKFRNILIEMTGKIRTVEKDGLFEEQYYHYVDLFNHTTIAGVAMQVYRTMFLEEKVKLSMKKNDGWCVANQKVTKRHNSYYDSDGVVVDDFQTCKEIFVSSPIAFIPFDLYCCSDNYSKVALQWVNWVSYDKNIDIQHALNGGEKQVRIFDTLFKLDGFHANEANNVYTAYEMNGCQWHGCNECYPIKRDAPICGNDGDTLNIRKARTERKKNMLENAGYTVISMWECQFKNIIATNPDVAEFIENLKETSDYLVGRLDPRDSFFGGRTNATKLYWLVTMFERINYFDFTSLYPDRMKYCRFGVGHPEIITVNFKEVAEYFGIIKLKILAPDNLYLPVLPHHSGGKLKFALCRTCAMKESQIPCTCSDDERAFIGTWGTDEVNLAIEMGYKVLKVYEVYHWEETTMYDPETKKGGLFTEYINTWLKIKQQASGWPDSVDIDDEESRQNYIRNYYDKEGILLDAAKIEVNPGLRAVSKLLLNSLWGKYGQRPHFDNTAFFHESQCDSFFALFLDKTKNVKNFTIVSNNTLMVEYDTTRGFSRENKNSNIFIASFTTMHARIKLYRLLQTLGERVLYMDTDSVIFVSEPNQPDPPLGDYLGDLTSEISAEDGGYIKEFVSAGPKNYAYRTPSGRCVCKIRGFSLNYENDRILNMHILRDMVTNNPTNTYSLYNERKICRSKTKSLVFNRPEERLYRMVYTKRIMTDDYDTQPFGYKGPI